ncbi:ComF family protein [Flaviaesturariibacter amylovorans]|uniref:ComF family protein n=1 Tax=Flaviaesturariibacter amylovorans TaxID=1084520 RepID=A0ABP8GA65_9BACT
MPLLNDLASAFLHLAFPHICEGCGTDVLAPDAPLCLRCAHELPATGFERAEGNPIDRIFWGRLPLRAATAQLYFTQGSVVQALMHRLKYGGRAPIGHYLGGLMGRQLAASARFAGVDALVPLPLHADRERRRGYNQAALLCEGIAGTWPLPVLPRAVQRPAATETQTYKGRVERWQNMQGRFTVPDPAALEGRHLLLVDDVVTTGATLEACGRALLAIPGVSLSIATLCFAGGS